MSYTWYAHKWHLNNATVAGIFAVYPVVVVFTLSAIGGMSDFVGRRTAILAGLLASIAGVASFSVAGGVSTLLVGRLFMGIGVGLAAGPASAILLEHAPSGDRAFASGINTSAQALGLTAATLTGGTLIQYAPDPAHLTFRLLLVLLVMLFAACWFQLPRGVSHVAPVPESRCACLPTEARLVVMRAAPAVMTAFVVGTVMLSLGAQIARDLVASENTLVNGVVIASFAIVWGPSSLIFKQMSYRRAVTVAGSSAAVSMLLLVAATRIHWLQLLSIPVLSAGLGYGLLFFGGLSFVSGRVEDRHKGLSFSMMYFAGYAMQGGASIVSGLAASSFGLSNAVIFGATVIATTSALAALSAESLLGGGQVGGTAQRAAAQSAASMYEGTVECGRTDLPLSRVAPDVQRARPLLPYGFRYSGRFTPTGTGRHE
jgi:predicted MFS family arabinose efflux permease